MTTEQPKVTVRPDGETVTTHPAFAQIVAARTSGGHQTLYGSDFVHNDFICIRICASELRRSLNRDWSFGRRDIIEVRLSEAQWATFVSSPNIGSGVPCTLSVRDGQYVPTIPAPTPRSDQFTKEMKASLGEVITKLDDLIGGAKTAAQKKEMQLLRQQIVSNLPFVADQFGRHVETTMEHAKAEIHGYMVGMIQRAGLEALTNGALPLQIEQDSTQSPPLELEEKNT